MDNQETNVKYCPNCGEPVEQAQKFCKGCGTQLSGEIDSDNKSNKQKIIKDKCVNFLNKNKKIIIIAAAITCAVIVVFSAITNSLSPREKYALEITESLIDSMKDPDSFKIQSDIAYVKIKSKSEIFNGKEAYYIKYSATNSYGANITSTACFFDGEFVDLEEDIEKIYESDYSSKDEYFIALKAYAKRLSVKVNLNEYLIEWNSLGEGGTSFEESEIISAKKIAKKAKCEYAE